MQKRKLIINADDLGYSEARDNGIFEAFTSRNSVLTSASLLVHGATSESAAAKAVQLGLPLGLHLNLTEGTCVSNESKSLIDPNTGEMRGKIGFRKALLEENSINLDDVKREIQAQIDSFRRLTRGKDPTHVDGHQHCHILPRINEIFAETLLANGIKATRLPLEWPIHLSRAPNATFLKSVYRDALESKSVFKCKGLVFPSHFMGLALSFNNSIEKVWTCLVAIPSISYPDLNNVWCEWMVHPGQREMLQNDESEIPKHKRRKRGFAPSYEIDDFALSHDRMNELNILTDPRLKDIVQVNEGFELMSFSDMSKSSMQVKDDEEQKTLCRNICILSSATPWTGNHSTALRLRSLLLTPSLESCCCLSVQVIDANEFSSQDEWSEYLESTKVYFVLAVHAYRAGRLVVNGRVPYMMILGGTDMNEPWNEEIQTIMKLALERASSIVAFNESLAEKVKRYEDANSRLIQNKLEIIPQSFLLTPPDSSFDFRGFVGLDRMERNGGPLMLLPLGVRPVKDPLFLVDEIKSKLPNAFLVIAGPILDKQLGEQLQKACEGNVRLIGPLPRERLLDAMRQSDIVLNTSISEGMSNVVLEGMALGTSLVMVRGNAGNRSLVKHRETGLVFETPEEFTSLVNEFWTNRQWGNLLIQRAMQSVQSLCSSETEAQSYLRLIRQVLDN